MEDAPLTLRALERTLEEEPAAFDFFQAVRLLERMHPERSPVGEFVDPDTELVRFGANPDISFPPGEIETLTAPTATRPAAMKVNFMGLIGPSGVLPHEYSMLALERSRARDDTFVAFLDLFHHRMVSLFYRAWRKQRIAVQHEQGRDERVREHLLDLVGLGLEGYRDKLPFPDDAVIFYAGLFGPQPRSALALEQLIEDFFDVPVEVEQFVGAWYPLAARDLCRVGEEDQDGATVLGGGAVVGDEIWDSQAGVRIRIGPLDRERFDSFLPSGPAHEQLRALARFFSHDQVDIQIQLVLERSQIPGFVLGEDSQRLGWSTWIRTAPARRHAQETILRLQQENVS